MNEAAYALAYALVTAIDARLERGLHYRTIDGRLITTLDQAIDALLTNTFTRKDKICYEQSDIRTSR